MKPILRLLKLTICGPGDVDREIKIAQEVVTEWNLQHGEARGWWVKHQHWSTDSHPDLRDRPQGVINAQLIDDAQIIVAVFWSRFGSPTGVADSGTEEEIRQGARLGKKVMVYFSDLEPLPAGTRAGQIERLNRFREELKPAGLIESFQSRSQFREKFARHLSLTINQLLPSTTPEKPRPIQKVSGHHNTVVGGDFTVNQKPPVIKPVFAAPVGSISPAQRLQVQRWITELVEGTARMSKPQAFKMWWQRLKIRMQVGKYEELLPAQMLAVETWYREQRAIQKRGLKTKAPDAWKNARYGAIKAAMKSMGLTNDSYYPELSLRLKMGKPFDSLTELTKTDLERVYTMALRDARTK